MKQKKPIPAPLDEKNVVTDFIECDIFLEGCAHQQQRGRHTYVGFYEGCPLLVQYTHGDNYLYCRFVQGMEERTPGMTLKLEQMLTAPNSDPDTNIHVTSQRAIDHVTFQFWFKDEE